jgi:hypothetical protein
MDYRSSRISPGQASTGMTTVFGAGVILFSIGVGREKSQEVR